LKSYNQIDKLQQQFPLKKSGTTTEKKGGGMSPIRKDHRHFQHDDQVNLAYTG